MGFRGVLLAVREDEGDASSFRVVCPDALLQLPTSGIPRGAPHVVEQKLVVTDFVTSDIQQVTRVSSVTLEHDTRSALWVAMAPQKLDLVDPAVLGGSTFAFNSKRNPIKRVCYCFYFRSDMEFTTFTRAHDAAHNLLHYSLLLNSLTMELEIAHDLTKSPAITPPAPLDQVQRRDQLRKEIKERKQLKDREAIQQQAQAICEQAAALAARRLKEQQQQQKQPPSQPLVEKKRTKMSSSVAIPPAPARALPPPTSAAVASLAEGGARGTKPVATPVECVLCGVDDECRSFAGSFVKHPYVLKDGRGAAVMMCKICLQRVLKRRLSCERGKGIPTRDELCGLCADSVEQIKGEVKVCAHPQCPRVYCAPCLKKLFGKAQVKKVWRTKHWHCPNCTPAGESAELSEVKNKHKSALIVAAKDQDQDMKEEEVAVEPEVGKKKQKRKRQHEEEETSVATQEKKKPPMAAATAPELDLQPPRPVANVDLVVARDPTTGKTMTLVDYASTYYEFLTSREEQTPPPEESEDVCFCCKDGGEVIECDWTHDGLQCPKVYHGDCLGFAVSDDGVWLCPRHRCYKCGFAGQFACRFCVTSFCNNHLPADVKKLGKASPEIGLMQYVLCAACDDMSLKAVEKKKISPDLYDRILHPAKPRKAANAPKPKKRTR